MQAHEAHRLLRTVRDELMVMVGMVVFLELNLALLLAFAWISYRQLASELLSFTSRHLRSLIAHIPYLRGMSVPC